MSNFITNIFGNNTKIKEQLETVSLSMNKSSSNSSSSSSSSNEISAPNRSNLTSDPKISSKQWLEKIHNIQKKKLTPELRNKMLHRQKMASNFRKSKKKCYKGWLAGNKATRTYRSSLKTVQNISSEATILNKSLTPLAFKSCIDNNNKLQKSGKTLFPDICFF